MYYVPGNLIGPGYSSPAVTDVIQSLNRNEASLTNNYSLTDKKLGYRDLTVWSLKTFTIFSAETPASLLDNMSCAINSIY